MAKNKIVKEEENIALSYEASIRYLVEKSNKRAWLVAAVSIFMAVLSIFAVCLLTPLKEVKPYVVSIDSSTGENQIVTVLDKTTFNATEALDRFFISSYIKHREGYHYNMLSTDYELVQKYSSAPVAKDYINLFKGEKSRQEVYKKDVELEVVIKSIVTKKDAYSDSKIATVRFIVISRNAETKEIKERRHLIATLSYTYALDKDLSEYQRLDNPLNFLVTDYRIDSELAQ